jgi:hypothetical protein
VDLLREAIEQLEAGGAAATAAQYRIKLAAVLRQLGRLEEASQWLPKADNLSAISRRSLLAERAQLQLTAGANTASESMINTACASYGPKGDAAEVELVDYH